MAPSALAELDVGEAALAWLAHSSFSTAHGPDIALGRPGTERFDLRYRDERIHGIVVGPTGGSGESGFR
jgi:hypothetical protein